MRKLQKHIISCNISLRKLQSTSTSINLNSNQPQLQSTSTSINLNFNQPQLNMAVTPKQPNLVNMCDWSPKIFLDITTTQNTVTGRTKISNDPKIRTSLKSKCSKAQETKDHIDKIGLL